MRKGSRPTSGAPRVAVLSVHTSPVDQPGIGDSGGMNVYILEVAGRLAAQGVHVDVFARCRGGTDHEVKELATGARVIPIKAGPCAPVPKSDLPRYLPEFLGGVLHEARFHGIPYDVVHSHYWLSGWVGRAATPLEAGQLVGLYGADPDHVRLVPPGVDHVVFSQRDRIAARERLHLTHLRFALYVGRLQPHKGPDVAIRTVAEAVARDPETTRDLVLGIVGGPSSSDGEADRLLALAHALGVADRVVLFPPQTQRKLSDFYAAADVVLVPSRSESFGLVALEAAACGTPVVAASVGGLRYVVEDGRTGFLVEGHDPGDHADRVLRLLRDPGLQASIGAEAARRALRFTWDVTANEVLRVYDDVVRAA